MSITRMARAAYNAGEKYFSTGVPCKNGHASLRYTSSSYCVECTRIQNELNAWPKDKANAYYKEYRKRFPEKVNAAVVSWHKRNPEKVAVIRARYQEKVRARRDAQSSPQP